MTQSGGEAREPEGAEAEQFRLGDFERLTGTTFPIEFNGASHNLTLVHVQEVPGSPREAGGFRLEFLGPSAPVIPQGIYAFPIEGASQDIFIVPRGPGANAAMLYEAVFF